MSALRELRFSDLDDAVRRADRLLEGGYIRRGNWTWGQICQHLRLVQDLSIDGYPIWMSLFAPARPLMRMVLLPRLQHGKSPKGIPTAPRFVPAKTVDDETEVAAFAKSVMRFKDHEGELYPHPAFGRLSQEELEEIHAAHAAHHLRFVGRKV